MDFGTLMAKNFSKPEPSYEFTRSKFVKTINEYVAGAFAKNVGKSQFGLVGTIEYPPNGPVPYETPPSSSVMSGRIIGFKSGRIKDSDYDAAAKASRSAIGSFWEKFFELIGKAFMRSSFQITPVTEYFSPPISQYSTPINVNLSYLNGSSYYKRKGNTFTSKKFLNDWRKAGKAFASEVMVKEVNDPAKLRNMLGKAVRTVASNSSMLYINYKGTIKFGNMSQTGLFVGLIYGKMKFD